MYALLYLSPFLELMCLPTDFRFGECRLINKNTSSVNFWLVFSRLGAGGNHKRYPSPLVGIRWQHAWLCPHIRIVSYTHPQFGGGPINSHVLCRDSGGTLRRWHIGMKSILAI